MNWFKRLFEREPNISKYRVMELESQLGLTERDFIRELTDRIEEQKKLINSLELQLLNYQKQEQPLPAEVIPVRRKINTVSELATIMESASLERKRRQDEKNSAKSTS